MITTLEELNNVINDVVNRIVSISTQKTSTGNWYAKHDDVSDLISEEDFLKYFDFIENELASREEVLDLNVTDDHELDAMYGLAWCSNYQWVEGDSGVFMMSEEEWEKNYKFEEVSQPFSLTKKAEILDTAIRNVQAVLSELSEDHLKEVQELFGCSLEDLARLDLPAAKEALGSHQEEPPFISFFVFAKAEGCPKTCLTFEEALETYRNLPSGITKELWFQTPASLFSRGDSGALLRWDERNGDWVNREIFYADPHIRLAAAKAALSTDPEDKLAWKRYNEAEELLGVTGHPLGENDLQVGNWRVHIIPPEAEFGGADCLINGTGKYLVEFYDLRYIHPEFSPQGQFTGGRYYAETLLGNDGWGHGEYPNGLSLDADIPAWTVTGPQMKVALDFIRENADDRKRPSLDAQIGAADKRSGNSTRSPDGRGDHERE